MMLLDLSRNKETLNYLQANCMAKKDKKNTSKKRTKKAAVELTVLTAANADKYELYQRSVQSPDADLHFLRRVYKKENGRPALHFREDFSGTGLMTAGWVKVAPKYTAEAFDIDPEPVEWGKARHFKDIGKAAERATLHLKDVREPSDKKPDVRCAQNFSYWIFKTREEMIYYFSGVLDDLAKDGIFVLDAHGGAESAIEQEEETEFEEEGFSYIWDQSWFSPVTHDVKFHIHFRFPDGTELNKAFTYEWRFWSLPELREMLLESGFSRVDIYWEGTDADGESGNGIYRKTRYGTNDPAWVNYIVAIK
jgi:hypothetical protein